MRKDKGKNKQSNSKQKKILELDNKAEKLREEYNSLFYDRSAASELWRIINEIQNIEFNIAETPLGVKEEDIKNLELLKAERKKQEEICNSQEDRRHQIEKELNKIGEIRIKLLVDPKSLRDIKKNVADRYNLNKEPNQESANDPIIRRVVSEIEDIIIDYKKYNPRPNQLEIARCIETKYMLYNDLVSKKFGKTNIDKKIYFEVISPHIKDVIKHNWSSLNLYKASSKK